MSHGVPGPTLNDSKATDMAFEEWIKEYSAGRWASDAVPQPPSAIMSILDTPTPHEPQDADSLELYSTLNRNSADNLLAFYKKHRYLPAPKSVQENERLRVMQKYGLHESRRKESVERICRQARRYFRVPTVVITLIFEHEQVMAAETGWDPIDPQITEPLRKLTLPAGVCTHAMTLQNPEDTFIIADSSKDWRFNGNPYIVANGGGLSFYASSNIFIPGVDTSGADIGRPIPVGTICIIDNVPRNAESFTDEDRATLRDLADMVAREFQLGYEQSRRQYETEQSAYLGTCLDTAFILPSPILPIPRKTSTSLQQTRASGPFSAAAEAIRTLTRSSSIAILDLRTFRRRHRSKEDSVWSPRVADTSEGHIGLLGAVGSDTWSSMEREKQSDLGQTVTSVLARYDNESVGFETPENEFCKLLGETTLSCSVPILDTDGTPVLLLVATSLETHHSFEASDRRFMRNMGAVIYGSLLRQRAIDADRAKMTFVGQISHDFRLPLHGIASQIDLIREFSPPAELSRLEPLLNAADVCLESLRDVLDDTLDIANFSTTTSTSSPNARKSVKPADLEALAEQVIRATWVRKQRLDIAENNGQQAVEMSAVKSILEVEQRDGGWNVLVDIGSTKRVLLNLLGNAIKFTKAGHVKVTLRHVPPSPDLEPLQAWACFEVEDTGCGMSEAFLRDTLFTPFMQEDSFSNGSGLGLSICQSLVKRLGGRIEVNSKIDQGTTIRVSFPLVMISSNPSSTLKSSTGPPQFATRIISHEFTPGVASPTPVPTTAAESTMPKALAPPAATSPMKKSTTASIAPDVKVLIAEDNPIARNILVKLLSGKGVSFVATHDGQQAVDAYIASQGTFNLFLADIQMPNKDGIEASHEIRAYEKSNGLSRCRIVALTGLSVENQYIAQLGNEGPIDSWIVKGGKNLKIILEEIMEVQSQVATSP